MEERPLFVEQRVLQALRNQARQSVGDSVPRLEILTYVDGLESHGLHAEGELIDLWSFMDGAVLDHLLLYATQGGRGLEPSGTGTSPIPDVRGRTLELRRLHADNRRWGQDYLVFGETPDAHLVYQSGSYLLIAKDDLSEIECTPLLEQLFESLLGDLWSDQQSDAERKAREYIRDLEEACPTRSPTPPTPLERLQLATLEGARDEFCRRRRNPISFDKVEIHSFRHPHLYGRMELSEPRRVWFQPLVGTMVGDTIRWVLDGTHHFSASLPETLSAEALQQVLACLPNRPQEDAP